MMTWEETIILLRGKPEYEEILFNSYLNDDPQGNVERFRNSPEFRETLKLIREYFPNAKNILEIGSGTGMSAASLALTGYSVTASDPDPGEFAGCGSIQKLKSIFQLSNLQIIQTSGESLPFESGSFDLVFVRQALHHADNLSQFLLEASRVIRPGGGFIAVREHVIFSEKDKKHFLQTHPLHSFYGEENAYRMEEYLKAINDAGLTLVRMLKYFESVINYFPLAEDEINHMEENLNKRLDSLCSEKLGFAGRLKLIRYLYRKYNVIRFGTAKDERRIPGRMYSFVAIK